MIVLLLAAIDEGLKNNNIYKFCSKTYFFIDKIITEMAGGQNTTQGKCLP